MKNGKPEKRRQQVYTLLVEVGRKSGDGLPDAATGAALMIYASGVDEAEAVRETVAILKDALTRHIALAFRDQTLTPPEYTKAVEIFGEPMQSQYSAEFSIDESPMVTTVSNQH